MTASAVTQSRPVRLDKLCGNPASSTSGTAGTTGTSDAIASDLNWMFALNQHYATELSGMTEAQFAAHIAKASYARVIDGQATNEPAAFILAFDQGANYDSPNFNWHKENMTKLHGTNTARFFYVDRVVVSPDHQRQGLARRLYEELFIVADARGHGRVLCEVNSDPPNPVSDAFHTSLGFKLMGEARLPERQKTVRYLGRIGPG